MNSDELKELLKTLHACSDAVEWSSGKSLVKAWETCKRADWMLWLCGRMAGREGWPTQQQFVFCSCRCAERVLSIYMKKYPDDLRLWKAIENVRVVLAHSSDAAGAVAYSAYVYAAMVAARADDEWAVLKEVSGLIRKELSIP
jgi:hypothetical protein